MLYSALFFFKQSGMSPFPRSASAAGAIGAYGTQKAVGAATSAIGGIVSRSPLFKQANALLGKYVGDLVAAGESPATAIVAIDIRTGKMVAATSGAVPAQVNQELLTLAQDAGGLGVKTACGNTIGRCAEFRAANELLNSGSRLQDIRFTNAIRPRTGEVIPTCDNCKQIFGSNLTGQ